MLFHSKFDHEQLITKSSRVCNMMSTQNGGMKSRNSARLKDVYANIINYDNKLQGLEKVGDERNLSVWTNTDHRWEKLMEEHHNTPDTVDHNKNEISMGSQPEDCVHIDANHTKYPAIIKQSEKLQQICDEENINTTLPVVQKAWFSIHRSKVKFDILKQKPFKYKLNGDFVEFQLVFCWDSGSDIPVASADVFSFLDCKNKVNLLITSPSTDKHNTQQTAAFLQETIYGKKIGAIPIVKIKRIPSYQQDPRRSKMIGNLMNLSHKEQETLGLNLEKELNRIDLLLPVNFKVKTDVPWSEINRGPHPLLPNLNLARCNLNGKLFVYGSIGLPPQTTQGPVHSRPTIICANKYLEKIESLFDKNKLLQFPGKVEKIKYLLKVTWNHVNQYHDDKNVLTLLAKIAEKHGIKRDCISKVDSSNKYKCTLAHIFNDCTYDMAESMKIKLQVPPCKFVRANITMCSILDTKVCEDEDSAVVNSIASNQNEIVPYIVKEEASNYLNLEARCMNCMDCPKCHSLRFTRTKQPKNVFLVQQFDKNLSLENLDGKFRICFSPIFKARQHELCT